MDIMMYHRPHEIDKCSHDKKCGLQTCVASGGHYKRETAAEDDSIYKIVPKMFLQIFHILKANSLIFNPQS